MGKSFARWASERLQRLDLKSAGIAIFLLALLTRLTYVHLWRTYLIFDGAEVERVAQTFAATGQLADPFLIPTGPTAIVAPVYPFLLGCVYAVFGSGEGGHLAQSALAATATSLQLALLPSLAVALGWRQTSGIIAGILGAVLPLRLWIETKGAWEAPFATLAFVLALLVTLRNWKRESFSLAVGFKQGVVWSLPLLTAPSLLTSLAGVLGLGFMTFRRGFGAAYLRCSLALVFGVLLVLTPWIVRNYWQLGGFVPVRSNLGLELAIANHDFARPTIAENLSLGERHVHPYVQTQEALKYRALGEIEYNRRRMKEALAWISSHPQRFGELTAWRIFYFWLPLTNSLTKRAAAAALTLLAFAGWFRLYREQRINALLFAAIWALYPLLYYFTQADPRYPYPIYWTFLLLTAWMIDGLLAKRQTYDPTAKNSDHQSDYLSRPMN